MAKSSLIGFIKGSKSMLFFCQVLNNQSDCDFKSVDSIFWHNSQKSNYLERFFDFLMDTNDRN